MTRSSKILIKDQTTPRTKKRHVFRHPFAIFSDGCPKKHQILLELCKNWKEPSFIHSPLNGWVWEYPRRASNAFSNRQEKNKFHQIGTSTISKRSIKFQPFQQTTDNVETYEARETGRVEYKSRDREIVSLGLPAPVNRWHVWF